MNKVMGAVSGVAMVVVSLAGCKSGVGPSAGLNDGKENYLLVAVYEDQSAEQIAREVAGMSAAFSFVGGGLGKEAARGGEADLSWKPWSYDGGWWSRSGSLTASGSDGSLLIQGTDSVQFRGDAGTVVQLPILDAAVKGTLIHHALFDLQGTDGGYVTITRDYRLDGSVDRTESGSTLTLSGSLAQTFKAEDAEKSGWCSFGGSARADGVVFVRSGLVWSAPQAGTISIDSRYKTIEITFDKGIATALISAKDGQAQKTVTVKL